MKQYIKNRQLALVDGKLVSCCVLFLIIVQSIFPAKSIAQKPELIIPATHSATAISISPNEQWLTSVGPDGVKIWDNKTGSLIKNLKPGGKNNERFNDANICMAFNSASTMMAMQIADSIYCFDFDRFSITKKIKINGYRTAMKFSSDGKTLFVAGKQENDENNYVIEKISIDNGSVTLLQKLNIVTLATHEITLLSLSANENQLLVYDAVIGSWLLDLSSNKIINQFKDTQGYYAFSHMPSGNLLAFSGEKEKVLYVVELDAKTYQPVRRSKNIFKDVFSVSAATYVIAYPSVSGKLGLIYQNDMVIFNTQDFSFTPKKELPKREKLGWVTKNNLLLSPSGSYYIQGIDMTRNNVANNAVISKYGQFPLDAYVQFVYKNKDAVCLKDRTVSFENGFFNMRLADTTSKVSYEGFLYRVTADGKTAFLYGEDYGLLRFDPNLAQPDYEIISKINSMHKKFVGMQIFDELNLLALIGNEGIYVLDLKTLKVLYIVDIPYGLHYVMFERLNKFCDIAADNSKMILFAESKEVDSSYISCVDLSNKDEKWNYQALNIENLRFVDNGKRLMFTSNEKLIYLDAETGKPIGEPIILPSGESETIISQSGKKAATQIPVAANVRAGSNIGLVDIVNKKQDGTMQGTGDDVYGFVFLHNERYMLTEEYGGLCIWDVDKKRKMAKLYMFENSKDWVLLAPDGRFDATEGAMKKMYFTRGKEIIPLESLYEKYYVPGLLKQIWENSLPDNVPDINDIKSPPSVKISLQTQDRNLFVADDMPVIAVEKEQVVIKAEADGLTDMVTEIRLYQNEKLVHSTRNLTVEDDTKGEKMMTRNFPVTLNPGKNVFKVVALNSQRTESLPAQLMAEYTPANVPPAPAVPDIQLYLLVVGVNTYKNPKYSLNYAQADAVAFAEAITSGSQNLFSKVNTVFLKDADATKDGISKAFESIKTNARPQDMLVFYYAGHGVINDKKEFFLVPYDVLQLYGNDDALAQKGFSAAALQQMSKDIKAQKQLFILDACQSAGALETIASARGAAEEKAIAQLARSTGTQWLTASGSEQFASEFSQLGHGSFTYCLLEAFKGGADQGDKKITVKELDAYLQTKVPEITQKFKGTPQYPASYSYGNDFPIIIIK